MHSTATTNTIADRSIRPLLDVFETADLLHVSVRYVRSLLTRGDLPVVRLGRRTLVRRVDIDAVIERGGFGDGG